jgi:uncharacterized membrane protein
VAAWFAGPFCLPHIFANVAMATIVVLVIVKPF